MTGSATNREPERSQAQAVDRYFEASLFLLVVTGFLTLAGTGRLDAPFTGLVMAALLVRGYLLARNQKVVVPDRWTSLATVVYVAFYVVDFLFVSASYVMASVHLLLFILVVKLFSVQRDRDHFYLILLSFLSVLSASVLTVDTVFLACLCAFLVLAVTTLASMEMRRSLKAEAEGGGPVAAGADLARTLSRTGVGLAVATIVAAVPMFFVLPRLSAGYLSSYSARNEFVSGFSEQVQLGEIGRIQQSSAVVMHVEMNPGVKPAAGALEPSKLADLKWRGVALARFDGRLWYNPPGSLELAAGEGRFDLWPSQVQRHNSPAAGDGQRFHPLRYRVVMEPLGTNVLFLLPVAANLQARIRELGIDSGGAVFNLDRGRATESYQAMSLTPEVSLSVMRSRSGEYPGEVAAGYLQLPEEVDPRVLELARQVTASAGNDYDRAQAIEKHLKTKYGYSLQMASQRPRDPLAYFLFERREGHCEYFASAMAMMLREVGIPSRIVNGFRMGEYNHLTGRYIIRGRDAHSWVEAYMPAYGWISFDPTPSDPRTVSSGWSRMLLYVDAAGEFWREWVINYDFLHQRTLTVSASRSGRQMVDEVRLWTRRRYDSLLERARGVQRQAIEAPRRWGVAGTTALGLALLLFNLQRLRRVIRSLQLTRSPGRAPQAAATLWYGRLLRTLSRRGLRKLPEQTPSEFVAEIPEPSLRSSVANFTEHYERARFGESVEDAERLPELYEEVVSKR